ncbi:hypothetical protein Tco_0357470 [Tanacetum coccineum]
MSADVARGHGGDGGGDDRPPTHHIPTGCGGCFVNRGKGTRKPNLGGRKAGRLHTRQETRNLGLKKITDDKGPVPIRFEWDDKKTLMPLGEHASHWSNYLGELIREMPLYYPSWQKVPAERKAAILTKIGINALARKGKQRGNLPGVGRVLPGRATEVLIPPPSQCTHNFGDVEKLKKKNKYLTKQVNLMMKLFRSDDKFSQMLNQYESTPEFGSGSGGYGDDEMADDEDCDEDEEDEEDDDS